MSASASTKGDVVSADGTRIGFERRGRGPGLVLVQGAMGTAYNFKDLAQALSSDFTVYMPDRRGRGMSPKPYDESHSITRDVEDLDAVLAEADANAVFGLSSGAMITLEAARTLPRISRAAVYEPPFYPEGISVDGIRRLHAQIEHQHWASALVTALLTAGTAPTPLRVLPRPVTHALAAVVLRLDSLRPGPSPKLRDLLPGIRYDFNDVAYMDGKMQNFTSLDKPVLLLTGTKSPSFLRQSIRTLQGVIPGAELVVLEGLDHSGSWNTQRGDGPTLVARALEGFFAWPDPAGTVR